MCNLFKPQSSAVTNWNVLTYAQVVAIFRAAGVTCNIGARDEFYWVTDENTTISILQEAHAFAIAYEYITAEHPGCDCDKFAHHACDVAYQKKVNGWFEVWGKNPNGGHGWNVLIKGSKEIKDGKETLIFRAFEAEPQEADMWEIGTNPNYQIKTVYHAD